MTDTPLVVGVAGSRRDGSHTLQGIERALAAAADAGADTDLVDLGDVDLPLYHPDRSTEESGEAAALLERVRAADGVIIGSPVYHGSYSSTFRNFHDYCGFDEYEDTAVGLLVVAGGGTIASTLDHLRVTMRGVHAHVVPAQVGVRNTSSKFRADGSLTDDDIADRIDGVAEDVVDAARMRLAAREPTSTACADD
ncbi:NADPH-dependent FMN reductase [Halobacterium litoreum]|uniref:NADPH-dependent FMN reductase n=1 Tax=Halobacterium litoreum TaxID=2039234 RepID=A0ABD5NEM7_9EURY|nr:NADPH-dependent FMN reductase [Halobacterium litoreum]UHH13355.1 NAD(P)H-dependent oxidoreductase [Halobacterium litoreum]